MFRITKVVRGEQIDLMVAADTSDEALQLAKDARFHYIPVAPTVEKWRIRSRRYARESDGEGEAVLESTPVRHLHDNVAIRRGHLSEFLIRSGPLGLHIHGYVYAKSQASAMEIARESVSDTDGLVATEFVALYATHRMPDRKRKTHDFSQDIHNDAESVRKLQKVSQEARARARTLHDEIVALDRDRAEELREQAIADHALSLARARILKLVQRKFSVTPVHGANVIHVAPDDQVPAQQASCQS